MGNSLVVVVVCVERFTTFRVRLTGLCFTRAGFFSVLGAGCVLVVSITQCAKVKEACRCGSDGFDGYIALRWDVGSLGLRVRGVWWFGVRCPAVVVGAV